MSQRVAGTVRRSQRSVGAAAAAAHATPATPAPTPAPTPAAAPKSTLDEPIFFASAAAFEDWLAAHHATETEVFVGYLPLPLLLAHKAPAETGRSYYKKASGRQTVTWSETVDAALCWGWIDGHGRGGLAGGAGFAKRFTPRRAGARSHWSRVNVAKAAALAAAGRLRAPGLAAWARRDPGAGTAQQPYERAGAGAAGGPRPLSDAFAARLAADAAAAAFWAGRGPGPGATAAYRRDAADWVMAAKRPATRERRLAQLIEAAARGARVKHLAR